MTENDIVQVFRRIQPILKKQDPHATFYDACLVVSDLAAERFERVFDTCLDENHG